MEWDGIRKWKHVKAVFLAWSLNASNFKHFPAQGGVIYQTAPVELIHELTPPCIFSVAERKLSKQCFFEIRLSEVWIRPRVKCFESSDSWKASAALDGRQASTEVCSHRQHTGHVVTILCSCVLTEPGGFVICRWRQMLSGWEQIEDSLQLWQQMCRLEECATKNYVGIARCENDFKELNFYYLTHFSGAKYITIQGRGGTWG